MALGVASIDRLVRFLENPLAALVIGVALGALMFLVSRRSVSAMGPDAPERGLAIAAASLFGRMVSAVFLLYVYDHFAPGGFPAFGLSLALVFLALSVVELVRFAGLHRYARPTRARG